MYFRLVVGYVPPLRRQRAAVQHNRAVHRCLEGPAFRVVFSASLRFAIAVRLKSTAGGVWSVRYRAFVPATTTTMLSCTPMHDGIHFSSASREARDADSVSFCKSRSAIFWVVHGVW